MDDRIFDNAIRALDGAVTRRRGLAALVGVLLGGAAIDESEAGKQARRRRARKHRQANRPANNGACPGTLPCTADSQCCTGYCQISAKKCRCAPEGYACTKKTTCCKGFTCYEGACTKNRLIPSCSRTCTTGCCNGETCEAGTTAAACGIGGAACAVCGAGKGCCANACATLTQTLLTIAGTGTSEISNPKATFLTPDKLTLYIASWNPADISSGGFVSIWKRSVATDPFTWDQNLTSPNFLKPEWVTVSADGLTVATVSVWNDCGVVFRKTAGTWAETGTLGTCGSGGSSASQLSSPSGVALSADGTKAYIGDQGNGRVSIWAYASSTWSNASTWGSSGGQCASGIDPNAKTCANGIFVNAAEDKIYICAGNPDRGLQVLTKSGASWTGAWAGPTSAAPYGGGGCWVDTITEDVFAATNATEVKKSNFTSGTSWDAVTLPATPASSVLGVAVRDFNAADPSAASWALAEGFSNVQVTGFLCP